MLLVVCAWDGSAMRNDGRCLRIGVAMRNSWNIYVARLALANWPKWCRREILCVSELLLKSSEVKILVSSDAGHCYSIAVLSLKAEIFISSVFFLKIILKPQEEIVLC